MHLSAIVAMSKNRVIGHHNKLPWHLPRDLQHFKAITLGKPIIMGRKTFESIGKALPGRCNVVITNNPHFQASGCVVAHSIETALDAVSDSDEVFVIGGSHLFEQLLSRVERLYLTLVDAVVEGDSFFPDINFDEWREVSREHYAADADNRYAMNFVVMEKNNCHASLKHAGKT